ncbi:heterogeneous nuclear ribonucleoprotein C-like isoform X1 [Asterias rubens]|uniref:heterogeneous nuclear ribonucleoprotein C-like isoform X1 n=1 Tax=Asterias rubens TaxID=7604 RepID=UPI001455691C|nr:heterogeneous nuclear ribonucleoprotein C-like isoform X1 [Asterias rubens]XP_033625792.1 heterogeneous nuclear ribonucleoprotein C-like isoform X1 [Asterias rubens]XP_033625793.1 heterogeneous nuclear ribonucleoprotein C-like isoform X1 [Asterias rubens]
MNSMFGGHNPGGFGFGHGQHSGFSNPQGGHGHGGPFGNPHNAGAHGGANQFSQLTPGISNVTNLNDMKSKASRIFIGNLNTGFVQQQDIEKLFGKYGRITGISIHEGFGFVQYTNELNARQAREGEYGAVLARQPLDVRIASEPNPNRPKGFKRVQGTVSSGYIDPASLPVIIPSGPPAAKKQKTFSGRKAQQFDGQGPSQWICSYCKDEADDAWELMKHVAIGHKTQIYVDDPAELAVADNEQNVLYDELS